MSRAQDSSAEPPPSAVGEAAEPFPLSGPIPGPDSSPQIQPVAADSGQSAGHHQPAGVPSHPGQETPVAQPDPQQPRKQRGGRNLQAAIGVGVGLGAVIVVSLFVVKVLFLFVVLAAVSVGIWELTSRLAERKQVEVPLLPLLAGGAAMLTTGYWIGPQGAAVSLALTALAVMIWRMSKPPENYLRDITAAVFTAFYVPFLATFVALMLAAHDGPQRIVLFLVVTVCSDTGAYAVGYKFGRNKLAPTISPGKTREGLAGGIGLSMLAGALLMQYVIDDGHWWQGLILGGCAAVVATLGDLAESMIKRDLGIKDMGTLLPGHGGIMDRLDSLLPTAPVVWLLLAAFVGS
ncbi:MULTISPECIES: phosphatidate cytidylyltransferase [unclassified Kitasatospora]|uniref:phosphatidate cytidylyltransferase n=1 Tax=unclassified Kitasatospora TaxID=2633591 RepID=UPI002473B1EA|nr:phosphatidate cytidylyltransferase [Kitasatospora sp. MAP12-44]